MPSEKAVAQMVELLENEYPGAVCSLEYEKPHELLFSVRLSAQCTDARVNMITPALFERFPTLEAFASADELEVQEYVRSCGFYRTKAHDLVAAAQMLLSEFDGVVPDNMDDLLRLPGVGRKTANLILGDVYNVPSSVVVDTHCIRISNRLGLVKTKDPMKIEEALRELLPPSKSNDFCHRLVLHGRAVCTARKPDCARCVLLPHCEYGKNVN